MTEKCLFAVGFSPDLCITQIHWAVRARGVGCAIGAVYRSYMGAKGCSSGEAVSVSKEFLAGLADILVDRVSTGRGAPARRYDLICEVDELLVKLEPGQRIAVAGVFERLLGDTDPERVPSGRSSARRLRVCPKTGRFALTATEVAQRLGVTNRRLTDMRARGLGPAWIKLGDSRNHSVAYLVDDLEAWVEANRCEVQEGDPE